MPPGGFETMIPASARPQTHALDRAATGIGIEYTYCQIHVYTKGGPAEIQTPKSKTMEPDR
jgi:hypothetical protein